MTVYEQLLNKADSENIFIIEKYDLTDTRLKGLYCDNTISFLERFNVVHKPTISFQLELL